MGLFTYGNRRTRAPLNSVLLCNGSIRRGLEADERFDFVDHTPPLVDDREVDRAAAAEMWRGVTPDLDVVVAQAALALEVLETARRVCPGAVRIVHRDSSHAVRHLRIMRAQQERYGIRWDLHYEGPLLGRETREYELADFVTVPSRWVLRTFVEEGLRDKVVHVGPQCVEAARWLAAPRRWRSGGQVFLHAGQLGLRKGTLDVLEAWAMAGAPGRLVVAGLPEHPAVAGRVHEALAGSPRTTYVNQVEFTRLAQFYRQGACLLHAAHEEGAAMVCFEAMLSGMPLIATEEAGCDVLRDGETGLLVPSGRPDLLAEAISRYARDDGLRYEHARRAYAAAAACDASAYAARYAETVAGLAA